jgi:predicted peroxiredoxin
VKETIFAFVGGSTLAEDVLQNGVKIISPLQSREYTGDIDEVLGNGVKTSHPRQYVGGDIVDKVIDKGVIETHDDVYHHKGRIAGVIKNGVKETKTPGEDGDLVGVLDWLEENETNSVPKMIDDVIENGVKETVAAGYTDPKTNLIYIKWGPQIDEVIDEGVKISRTYISGSRQKETTEIIIKYGTKNPTD